MSNLIFELQFQSASSHLNFRFQLQIQLKVNLGPVQPQLIRYNFFIFSFWFNFLCTHYIHLLSFFILNSSTNATPSLLLFSFTLSTQIHIFINDFVTFQLNYHALSSYFVWLVNINSNYGWVWPSLALVSRFLLRSK